MYLSITGRLERSYLFPLKSFWGHLGEQRAAPTILPVELNSLFRSWKSVRRGRRQDQWEASAPTGLGDLDHVERAVSASLRSRLRSIFEYAPDKAQPCVLFFWDWQCRSDRSAVGPLHMRFPLPTRPAKPEVSTLPSGQGHDGNTQAETEGARLTLRPMLWRPRRA